MQLPSHKKVLEPESDAFEQKTAQKRIFLHLPNRRPKNQQTCYRFDPGAMPPHGQASQFKTQPNPSLNLC